MNSRAYSTLQWMSRLVYRCGAVCITCSMFVIVLLVAGQVASRYVLNDSIVWANEAVTLLLVWTIYVGAALAIHDDEMVAITILVQHLNKKGRAVVRMVVDTIMISFVLTMIYLNQIVLELSSTTPMPVMQIAKSWSHLSLTIGFLICVLFLVKNVVDTVMGVSASRGDRR